MPQIQIMPSLLAADMAALGAETQRALVAGSDGLHVDVMDGHFVPNLSMGPAVVEALRRITDTHLSVHLMISRPDLYAEVFCQAGASSLLIHIESEGDIPATLRQIRSLGVRAGITLNPETPVDAIRDVLREKLVDEVLIMSVHPGFGGQSFIPEVLPKIATIRTLAPDLDISIDGGIDQATAVQAASYGGNILLAGTSLFKAADMSEAIATMRAQTEKQYGSAFPT